MVTRKPALVAAAASLPAEPSDLTPGLVVPGYVASVTTDSAFVRFLGELTGRAGRQQISGSARGATAASCQELVRVGQTVLARVEQADVAANRFPLSLRVKSTGAAATGGQLVLSMCRDLELAATLQAKHAAEEEERDEEDEEVPVEVSEWRRQREEVPENQISRGLRDPSLS